jgi:hypothetical protein
LLAVGDPVESLFRVVGTYLRNGGRTETQKAGLSAAWLEFEDLFQAAANKRKKLKANQEKASSRANLGAAVEGSAPQTPPHAGTFGADSDDEQGGLFTPPRAFSPARSEIGSMNEDSGLLDEHRQQVAKLEGMIEDAQSQYNSSIRQQLQHRLQGGADANGQTHAELYENVRRWQEQLAPVLKEFESHPEFDINVSGSKFLNKMVALENNDEEDQRGKAIPFARLVHGHPRWEVCRRFLTCLILTNQGNTEIVYENDRDRIDRFSVKLLKAEKPHLSLYDEEPASAVPIQSGCAEELPMSPAQTVEASVRRVSTPLRRGSKRSRDSFDGSP